MGIMHHSDCRQHTFMNSVKLLFNLLERRPQRTLKHNNSHNKYMGIVALQIHNDSTP